VRCKNADDDEAFRQELAGSVKNLGNDTIELLIKNRVDKQLLLTLERPALVALNVTFLDAQRIVNWQKQIEADRLKQEKQVEAELLKQADQVEAERRLARVRRILIYDSAVNNTTTLTLQTDKALSKYLKSKRAAGLKEFVDDVLLQELHIDISSLKSGLIYALESDVIDNVEKVLNSLQSIVRTGADFVKSTAPT